MHLHGMATRMKLTALLGWIALLVSVAFLFGAAVGYVI